MTIKGEIGLPKNQIIMNKTDFSSVNLRGISNVCVWYVVYGKS